MTSDFFRVSVITPVYNAERFVRRAVGSVVHLPEVDEIILIDDAGPDNSLEICRQLENEFPKVRLLQHSDKGNHGAGASRNLGIEQASCEFVAFLDADDYYLPNRFEREKEIFINDSEVDGVYGAIGIDYESETARQQFLDAGYGYQEFLTVTGVVPPEELIEVLFHCHSGVTGEFHTDAITVRKAFFMCTGLFNEKLLLRQDIHLWKRMAAIGRLSPGSIDKAVAIRGVHGENRMINLDDHKKYADFWWKDLEAWFGRTSGVPNRALRAFRQAYCSYKVKNRAGWEARKAFSFYSMRNPRTIAEPNGFFDLNFLKAFGRNWFTLHFLSVKNRLIGNVVHYRQDSS